MPAVFTHRWFRKACSRRTAFSLFIGAVLAVLAPVFIVFTARAPDGPGEEGLVPNRSRISSPARTMYGAWFSARGKPPVIPDDRDKLMTDLCRETSWRPGHIPTLSQPPSDQQFAMFSVEEWGWPCPSVRGWSLETRNITEASGLWPVPAWARVSLPWKRADTQPYYIPGKPVWAGLFVNVVVWSAFVLLLSYSTWPFSRARALIRRAKGQCAKCGYDLRGLQTDGRCPECGWNRPQSADAQAAS